MKDMDISAKTKGLLENNLRLLFSRAFLAFPAFWVSTLFYYIGEDKGLSESTIFFFFGLSSFLIFLLEIPTGVISDKISRKGSVSIGYLVNGLAFIALILLPGIYSMLAYSVLIALGLSLVSGSIDSLIYDTLDLLGRRKEYKEYIPTYGMIMILSGALYSYLGGIMGEYSLVIPMAMTAVSYILLSLIMSLTYEPPISRKAEEINQGGYVKHTIRNIKRVIGKKGFEDGVVWLITSFSLLIFVQNGLKYIIPPIFEGLGVTDYSYVSGISGLSLLLISLSAFLFLRVLKKGSSVNKATFGLLVTIVGIILLMGSTDVNGISALILLVSFSGPIVTTVLDQRTNDLIDASGRATILSLRSMIARGVTGISIPVFGYINEVYGYRSSMSFLLVIVLLGAFAYLFSLNKVSFKES